MEFIFRIKKSRGADGGEKRESCVFFFLIGLRRRPRIATGSKKQNLVFSLPSLPRSLFLALRPLERRSRDSSIPHRRRRKSEGASEKREKHRWPKKLSTPASSARHSSARRSSARRTHDASRDRGIARRRRRRDALSLFLQKQRVRGRPRFMLLFDRGQDGTKEASVEPSGATEDRESVVADMQPLKMVSDRNF